LFLRSCPSPARVGKNHSIGSLYAMFYVAEALLLSRGLAFSKHSAVIAAFGKEFAKEGVLPAELHAHLREASDARNVADYQRTPT